MINTNLEHSSTFQPITLQIPTLQLIFQFPLRPHQIGQWRGAVCQSAGWEKDAFHNHRGGDKHQYHYRYPLIQYRTHRGLASVLGVGAGSQALRQWILSAPPAVQLGQQLQPLTLHQIKDHLQPVSMHPDWQTYYIHQYLPFNGDNYQRWKNKANLIEGIELLQKVLVGHLLNFATGIDWEIPEHLTVEIMEPPIVQKVKHYQTARMAFDLCFKTNMQLPRGIGIGKGCSHGFGVVRPFRQK
ncbi:MAG: CRISPR-associated endonuclease Cas6 [Bacteroidota bacterium]